MNRLASDQLCIKRKNKGERKRVAGTLENLWKLPVHQAVLVFAAIAVVVMVLGYASSHRKKVKKLAVWLVSAAVVCGVMQIGFVRDLFSMVKVPRTPSLWSLCCACSTRC